MISISMKDFGQPFGRSAGSRNSEISIQEKLDSYTRMGNGRQFGLGIKWQAAYHLE
jgi:hypothetical protein